MKNTAKIMSRSGRPRNSSTQPTANALLNRFFERFIKARPNPTAMAMAPATMAARIVASRPRPRNSRVAPSNRSVQRSASS